MTLKTLEKTTWNKIKIGEVFAHQSCWTVIVKLSKNTFFILDSDWRCDGDWVAVNEGKLTKGDTDEPRFEFDEAHIVGPVYKLPQSVQKLWRQD